MTFRRGRAFKFVEFEGLGGQCNKDDEARGEIRERVLSRLSRGYLPFEAGIGKMGGRDHLVAMANALT